MNESRPAARENLAVFKITTIGRKTGKVASLLKRREQLQPILELRPQ